MMASPKMQNKSNQDEFLMTLQNKINLNNSLFLLIATTKQMILFKLLLTLKLLF